MNSKSDPRWPLRIVHLEDSVPGALLVKTIITLEWPQAPIERVETSRDSTEALKSPGVDVILADDSLPAFDGLVALDIAKNAAAEARPAPPALAGSVRGGDAAPAAHVAPHDFLWPDG